MATPSTRKLVAEAWKICDEVTLPYLRLRRNEKGKIVPDYDFREGLWFWAEDLHPCLTEISMTETLVELRAAGTRTFLL